MKSINLLVLSVYVALMSILLRYKFDQPEVMLFAITIDPPDANPEPPLISTPPLPVVRA